MEKVDRPNKVLSLNKDYYITCDRLTWKLVKKNVEGNDQAICFAPIFSDMLHIVAERFCKIPADVAALGKKMDEIHKLIDKKFPDDISPSDLGVYAEKDDGLF